MLASTLIQTTRSLKQGTFFVLNGAAVSWRSSKQNVVAASTLEAEYMAASEAAREGIWLKEFTTELGVIPNALDPMDLHVSKGHDVS